VALVCGGDGLGLALASELARTGADVIVATADPDRMRSALDGVGDVADHIAVRHLDPDDRRSIDRLVATLDRQFGRCDVLIQHCAAVHEVRFIQPDVAVTSSVPARTRLLGIARLIEAVGALMARQHHGRVVTLTSLTDPVRWREAVVALTRTMAAEMADLGILVNCFVASSRPSGALTGPEPEVVDAVVRLATCPTVSSTGRAFHGFSPRLR
jgi:NAD(P)-dependent dehydrogenase (short-subunit alcohol dehydrogenase family)